MSAGRVTIAAIVVALLLALAGTASQAVAASKPPSPQAQVKQAFNRLAGDVRHTPRRALSKRNRAQLLKALKRAQKLSKRKPCQSIRALGAFRHGLRRVHERRLRGRQVSAGSFRGTIQADLVRLNAALMQLPRSRRCGGGRPPKVTQATSTVVESDQRHLRMRISLPAPTFVPKQVGGTEFEQMYMQGTGETGDVGKPGLPVVTENFGIPTGANVSLKVNGAQGYNLHGVNLFPHQKPAVDLKLPPGAPPASTFADPPFTIDSKAYDSKAPFPPKPSDAAALGAYRSLSIGGVDFAGGQYRPKTDTLHVFTSIDVTVTFGGDNKGTFGDGNDITGPWSSYIQGNYRALVSNWSAIAGHVGPTQPAPVCGSDMLIVTSPDLAPAAETLRSAKQAQGYSPLVKTTADIGASNTAIADYIHQQLLSDCLIPLQYVIFLGNTAAVPTFIVPCSPGGNVADCNIASDLPYSLNPASLDLFADVELGRIPATDLASANAVVNKIVSYENNMPAPAGDDFYRHATVTGYFQPPQHCVLNAGASGTPDCDEHSPTFNGHWEIDYSNHQDDRGFTKVSDQVLRAMTADGYAVDRLWTTDNANVMPERYYDGTDIPTSLRRPAFAWNADTTDFLNAYDAGRFLILHRDHGWPDGWAAPTLTSADVPSFTNGSKLPVVFGVNCASAAFDDPTHPSFVELQVERPDGGAVAGFGDTRVSPTFPNNHITTGFFDALFPNLVPGYGSSTPTRRLGDVLLRGKRYMATQEGVDWQGSGDTYVENYLYHLIGDPSLQMWAAAPQRFDVRQILAQVDQVRPVNPGDPTFNVAVHFPTVVGQPAPAGTVVTLYHDGDAIGRGVVGADGNLTIVPDQRTSPQGLTVSYQQDGTLPAQDSVDNQQPPPPPPQSTSLTLTGPRAIAFQGSGTFSGALSPAFAGAKIRIVYKRDDPQNPGTTIETVEQAATTGSDGSFSDKLSFDASEWGTWHAQAFFDGDATHAASSSPVFDFTVDSG